jgi:DNA gyrase subunit A
VIRASEDTAEAKLKLTKVFNLSEIQAQYILEMPLRRLTKFSVIELETEKTELKSTIKQLTAILNDPSKMKETLATELDEIAVKHAKPRRTAIMTADDGPIVSDEITIEIPDQPCLALYSQAGILARTESDQIPDSQSRFKYDAVSSYLVTRSRGEIGLVTSEGRLFKINVVDLPVTSKPGLASNVAASSLVSLRRGEQVIGISNLDPNSTLAVATELGVIKRVDLSDLPGKDVLEVINLKGEDKVIGCGWIAPDDEPLGVFITEDARLLQFELADIRAQGRNATGVAGMKTTAKGRVIGFFVCHQDDQVATIAAASDALPGTNHSSIKLTSLDEFAITARGGSGVRCHKFRKGESSLALAYAGASPIIANIARGGAVAVPELSNRDATGEKLSNQITALGSSLS